MTKTSDYRRMLRGLDDWDTFLRKESGLPGPRGNLSLADAAAEEGDQVRFHQWLKNTADIAPTNTQGEFLAFCGAVGLGRLLAEGHLEELTTLRACASDPRWRMREGVAMALQRWGDADMTALIAEMEKWSRGNCLEQRAAAAALCEPRLLQDPEQTQQVLHILDHITISVFQAHDRRNEAFLAMRKGLGYCWSVAVVASPQLGKQLMAKWLTSADKDIRWIMRENLKKDRLLRMDPNWVAEMQRQLST